MTQSPSPSPVNKQNLSKASVAGIAMAIGGIILFVLLYAALGNAGVDALTRMLVALCVPPALMAALVGGYFLLTRPAAKKLEPPRREE
jgi:hypothetical protein